MTKVKDLKSKRKKIGKAKTSKVIDMFNLPEDRSYLDEINVEKLQESLDPSKLSRALTEEEKLRIDLIQANNQIMNLRQQLVQMSKEKVDLQQRNTALQEQIIAQQNVQTEEQNDKQFKAVGIPPGITLQTQDGELHFVKGAAPEDLPQWVEIQKAESQNEDNGSKE